MLDADTERYPDVERDRDLRWWAAANYLTVAQIYLQDNVLLREPLAVEHIKPRLLGHWGTSPGLSMIYTLLNRLIRRTDTDCLYVAGPGHGGPAHPPRPRRLSCPSWRRAPGESPYDSCARTGGWVCADAALRRD